MKYLILLPLFIFSSCATPTSYDADTGCYKYAVKELPPKCIKSDEEKNTYPNPFN